LSRVPGDSSSTASGYAGSDRLYQVVARRLLEAISSGRYAVGERLPAERDLAIDYNVSRPTVREALIALEVKGLVEIRLGSGAYVRAASGSGTVDFGISAFELTEARLLFEGEAAALAASQITDEEIAKLGQLLKDMERENRGPAIREAADREFHLTIARATRNAAVVRTIEELWDLRSRSPEAALVYSRARAADVKPVVQEHVAILGALRSRDARRARAAMRGHLSSVLDHLLAATEERTLEAARRELKFTRDRYSRASKL
jgi:GntR family transcriptional regulator, hexuronate regulon transcriptional repressor